ncbi:alpha/beta fold hydrolase [Gilvibacter sp.]|uniref:YheT family hydrolase n=1 Tax=Gilvibacter sp. TaxID=2729997 RepID=UPI0025BC234E|nr:alpha/beta fold hydrolase [Gilvibacter sp.]NQX77479.1 alpha/beta fold hydrolase [Gilvibacter sp.]
MPLVTPSYQPASWISNGHLSTIYSAKIRRVSNPYQQRQRLELPDGDFVDIDLIVKDSSSKFAILLHGLEGNSTRSYMKGAAQALEATGWNIVALNFRGCSGSPNRMYYSYNAGRTEDLEFLIQHVEKQYTPSKMALVGFSLGGNLLLKFLGSKSKGWEAIDKAVAVSAPVDLRGTLLALNRKENWLYRTVFLRSLKQKLHQKAIDFPDQMDHKTVRAIDSLLAFDNQYTAPAHGFKDAIDYYTQNSCGQFLSDLETPSLLLNAANDSFLKKAGSYPVEIAENSDHLFLEVPVAGGHVGFVAPNNLYYSEQKICTFLNE